MISIVPTVTGYLWAVKAGKKYKSKEDLEALELDHDEIREKYDKLPSAWKSFAPILVPIILITLGSIAAFPTSLWRRRMVYTFAF